MTSAFYNRTLQVHQMANEIQTALNGTNGSDSNSTADPADDRDQLLVKFEIITSSIILYLALFGNTIVLLVLKLRGQKLSRMQWFIVHLAIADLFVAFFNVLPMLVEDITYQFHGNDFLCRAVKYFQVVAMYASSYVLVMTAVDRYVSICLPLTNQTLSPNRVHMMIALAWLISLLFSIPQLTIFHLVEDEPGLYLCYAEFAYGWGLKAYVTWVFVADYAVPFLILTFCYGRICLAVWASVGSIETASINQHDMGHKSFRMRISFRRTQSHNGSILSNRDFQDTHNSMTSKKPRGHARGAPRSKVKTIKLTLTVVLCYLVCWAPFFISNISQVYGEYSFENPVNVIIQLLASLNSCCNPWIYLAFSGRSCPKRGKRRSSPSWAPSTHYTSGGESMDMRSRSSFMDLSHGRLAMASSPAGSTRRSTRGNSHC